jgi:hypothetical protein
MITLGEAAAWYRQAADTIEDELGEVVVTVTALAVERAKGYIGHEQDEWAPLSGATIEGFRNAYGFRIPGKRELGYSPPDYEPLLRSGQMRESIEGVADGLTGIIGSADKVMLYQEMGTPNARYPIPPRPVLALALMNSVPDIIEGCGEVAVKILVPEV